jgi:hypothetical protein
MIMKIYVASSIKNKEKVQELFGALKAKGHEVTTDWTLTDDIPEDERRLKRDYMRSIAKRDFEGIRECDVFVLLSKPSEGRSMYVELGLAIAMHEAIGKPSVFVVGPDNDESVFYFHPAVQRVHSLAEALEQPMRTKLGEPLPRTHEGRLEEYKALRSEMLEIIKDRIWGQATYAVLVAGVLALTATAYKVHGLIFIIALAVPFLFHTIQREHARIRMGNYLRVVLEPQIPGMYWEEYLGLWRGRFGRQERQGWLNMADRAKHIFSFSGLYLLTSFFCWFLLLDATMSILPRLIGSCFLIVLVVTYGAFFKLYDKGAEEYEDLWRLSPKG